MDHFLKIAPVFFPVFPMLILSSGGSPDWIWSNYRLLISKSFFYFPQTLFQATKSHFSPRFAPWGKPTLDTQQGSRACQLGAHCGHSRHPPEGMGGKQRGWRREEGTRRNATLPDRGRSAGTRRVGPGPRHHVPGSPEASAARSRTSADPPWNPGTARTRAGSPDAPAARRSSPGASPTAPPGREIS